MDISDLLRLVTTYWYIFPVIALIMWLFLTAMIKKIMNRVLYIRLGGTMEFFKTIIKGTNLYFKPNPKAPPITVHIEKPPYLYSKGLSTYRVYVVSEGGGATINFPNPISKFFAQESIQKEWRKWTKTYPDEAKIMDSEGKVLLGIAQNVSAEGQTNPQGMVASASISLFERWTQHLAEHLPKTKGEWMMIFIYIVIGFGMGIAWGMLIGTGALG